MRPARARNARRSAHPIDERVALGDRGLGPLQPLLDCLLVAGLEAVVVVELVADATNVALVGRRGDRRRRARLARKDLVAQREHPCRHSDDGAQGGKPNARMPPEPPAICGVCGVRVLVRRLRFAMCLSPGLRPCSSSVSPLSIPRPRGAGSALTTRWNDRSSRAPDGSRVASEMAQIASILARAAFHAGSTAGVRPARR